MEGTMEGILPLHEQPKSPTSNGPQPTTITSHHHGNPIDFDISSLGVLISEAVELIPIHEKSGFLKATQLCPNVMWEESNPICFLQFEKYNIHAAAFRLVKYWEWRELLFKEYAFIPLMDINLHRDNEDFYSFMQDDALVLLPFTDIHNNSIVYFDKSKFKLPWDEIGLHSILRVVFYVWTLIFNVRYRQRQIQYGTNPVLPDEATEAGIVFLNLIYSIPNIGQIGTDIKALWQEAFPIEVKYIHILFLASHQTSFTRLCETVVPIVLSKINVYFSSFARVIPHICYSPEDIIRELKEYGIEEVDALSTTIIGTRNNFSSEYYKMISSFELHGHRSESLPMTTMDRQVSMDVSRQSTCASNGSGPFGEPMPDNHTLQQNRQINEIKGCQRIDGGASPSVLCNVVEEEQSGESSPIQNIDIVTSDLLFKSSPLPLQDILLDSTIEYDAQTVSFLHDILLTNPIPQSVNGDENKVEIHQLDQTSESTKEGESNLLLLGSTFHNDEDVSLDHYNRIVSLFYQFHGNIDLTSNRHIEFHKSVRAKLFVDELNTSLFKPVELDTIDKATYSTNFIVPLVTEAKHSDGTTKKIALLIDLNRAIGCSVESQQRCLFYILRDILTASAYNTCITSHELQLFLFVDYDVPSLFTSNPKVGIDQAVGPGLILTDTLLCFPYHIKATVHVLLQPISDSDYSEYVEHGTKTAMSLFHGIDRESVNVHKIISNQTYLHLFAEYDIAVDVLMNALKNRWKNETLEGLHQKLDTSLLTPIVSLMDCAINLPSLVSSNGFDSFVRQPYGGVPQQTPVTELQMVDYWRKKIVQLEATKKQE